MSAKKLKVGKNNENVYHKKRKRIKTLVLSSNPKSIIETAPQVFEEMGVAMLDSEESTSPMSAIGLNISPSDENSNDITSNDTQTHFGTQQCNQKLNSDLEIKDNSSFSSPYNKIVDNNNTTEKTTELQDTKFSCGDGNHINSSKSRSPLTTVACNHNHKSPRKVQSCTAVTPTTSSGSATQSDISTLTTSASSSTNVTTPRNSKITDQSRDANDLFFLFRNEMPGKDYFSHLSDEIILHIFQYLPKKTLLRCSYVNRRFNRCARDESLWIRMDLGGKALKAGCIAEIMQRGIVILRLAQARIIEPVIEPEFLLSYPEFECRIQYLDLSMANISAESLQVFLSRCRQLKKLSLEHVQVNDDVCIEISRNLQLETLNLTMVWGLREWGIRNFIGELKNLNSLNISWTNLDFDGVTVLVRGISSNIMRLNVAGCRRSFLDTHVSILSKRCPNLLELDASDCSGLTIRAFNYLSKFKNLEYLSLSRCYRMLAPAFMEISRIPSLKFFDVFGMLSDDSLEMLEQSFPDIAINKFIHSSVARPTVGTRRTSIWGLRTRD